MRRLWLTLLALLAAAPAHAATKPPSCARLKGKSELSTKRLRVVRRPTGGGLHELAGCALPHGRVRILGREEDQGLGGSFIHALAAAGTWVRVQLDSSDQYASGTGTWLFDVRTGREEGIFSASRMMGDPYADRILELLEFDGRGRAVSLVGTPQGYDATTGGPTSVAQSLFVHAPGTLLRVDQGSTSDLPPADITLAGGVVSWTHAGEPRSVTFDGP